MILEIYFKRLLKIVQALNKNLRWVDWAAEEMSFDVVTRLGVDGRESKMAINLKSTAES